MTLLELQQILSAVIAGVPASEAVGKRPNTFVVLGGRSDLEAANFNKTFESMRGGTMFIRRYDNADDAPEQMTVDYPLVGLEALEGSGGIDIVRWSVNLICLDQLKNLPTLDADGRSAEQIESDTEYILANVFRTAAQYQKFNIGGGLTVWGIPSEVLTAYPTATGLENASSVFNNSAGLTWYRPHGTKDGTVGSALRFSASLQIQCAEWV